jgi:hypothetical protein
MNRHLLSIAVCLGLVTTGTATTVCAQSTDPAGDNPFARYLLDKGINLRGALIDQYARNPTGGVREGSTNVGQFNIGLDLMAWTPLLGTASVVPQWKCRATT